MSNRPYPRQRGLDLAAFDAINEQSAYWLGFLFADGYVPVRGIVVRLTADDRGHLVKLQAFLGSDHAIQERASETVRGYVCRPSCTLAVPSVHLARRVRALGRYEGDLPPELALSRDFWRGVFDGDGSLFFTKKGYPAFSLVGPRRFMEAFLAYLRTRGLAARMKVQPHKSIFSVSTAGHSAAAVIQDLYEGAGTVLDRKKQKADEILARERHEAAVRKISIDARARERAEACRLYAAGLSMAQVARCLGVSDVAVMKWVHAAGVPTRPRTGGRPSRSAGITPA